MRAYVVVAIVGLAANQAPAQWDYKDWSATFTSTAWLYGNTSSAGVITGSSNHPGFMAAPGSWGVPTAITTNNMFTNGFQVHGTNGLNSYVEFDFSAGYGWGTGGRLFIGNIHNYYEYTLSAWDFSNNQIDVNNWLTLNEWQSSAPGTVGYFSTSPTSRSAVGLSSRFYVYDSTVNKDFGQGGVVLVDGLVNVKRIRLALTNSALAPNAQQVDFILFNVGTPVPAPASATVLGAVAALTLRRRRR